MPRLYHTKSKTGCARCRSRRVKCDEARPVCGGCHRHKVHCHYDRAPQPKTGTPSTVPATPVDNASPAPPTETRERRYLELRLLHTFVADICPHTAGTHLPVLQNTWVNEVPRMALEHEPLLNAIMSISCLYLLTQGRDTDPELELHRANYLEATVQQHRETLANMTKENSDPACFVSVLLTMDAFANLRFRQLEPYEPPLHWLQMSRGLGGVFQQAIELLKDNPGAKMRSLVDTAGSYVKPDVVFCKSNREGLEHLLHFREGEIHDESDVTAYENVVSYIGSVIRAMRSSEDPKMISRRLTSFSVIVSARFIELLRFQKPRALVFLAHFFALASCVRYTWWVGPSPGREIRAIQAQLGQEWQALMSWPIEQLEKEPYAPDEKDRAPWPEATAVIPSA
ncbi:hypothetical protein NW759_002286 [Fusarium solani]|nr:hypothetical protein NW759_002286 [Fusarium solani]